MTFIHSFKDIQQATGLKMDFIRKIYNANQEIFRPHSSRGNNNSVLFNDSGYTLFDQIKQRKEAGANIPEISAYLRQSSGQSPQTNSSTPQIQVAKPAEESITERLLEKVDAVYALAIKAKEETIEAQKQQITDLRSSLLLLTDGRSPEEIKRQREEQAAAFEDTKREAERVARELAQERQAKESAERERGEALQALELERSKVEQALKDSQARETQVKAWAQWEGKRAALLQEYQKLSWLAGKRKSEIKKALAELEKEKPELADLSTGIPTEAGE